MVDTERRQTCALFLGCLQFVIDLKMYFKHSEEARSSVLLKETQSAQILHVDVLGLPIDQLMLIVGVFWSECLAKI